VSAIEITQITVAVRVASAARGVAGAAADAAEDAAAVEAGARSVSGPPRAPAPHCLSGVGANSATIAFEPQGMSFSNLHKLNPRECYRVVVLTGNLLV
jgi:hypothetical protein